MKAQSTIGNQAGPPFSLGFVCEVNDNFQASGEDVLIACGLQVIDSICMPFWINRSEQLQIQQDFLFGLPLGSAFRLGESYPFGTSGHI